MKERIYYVITNNETNDSYAYDNLGALNTRLHQMLTDVTEDLELWTTVYDETITIKTIVLYVEEDDTHDNG